MSMKSLAMTAVISFVAAGAALASPAKEQIAATLGVDASQFTLNQLVQLEEAVRENDAYGISHIAAQVTGGIKAASVNAAGEAQRAAVLGVEAGKYTPSELTLLEIARDEADLEAWNFIASGANRTLDGGDAGAGKAQLAASLGLNGGDYSLAELTAIAGARE